MRRCPVLKVLHRFRAGARVPLLLSTDANSVWRRGQGQRRAGGAGPRPGPEERGAPGRPRARSPHWRGAAPQPCRVGVNSEPGAAVPRSGPREAGKVGTGTSPPLSPRFPKLSWSGAAPEEVFPEVRGWGLPQLLHPGRSGAQLRGTVRRA